MLLEPMYAVVVHHQIPPEAYGPFADFGELFSFLLSSNRADNVSWYRFECEDDWDGELPEEAKAMLKQGPIVWAGIGDAMEFYPLHDAPDHLHLLCEAVFGDSHWYGVGEYKSLIRRLPEHQRHAAERELDRLAR
jgi:hypothetical protein